MSFLAEEPTPDVKTSETAVTTPGGPKIYRMGCGRAARYQSGSRGSFDLCCGRCFTTDAREHDESCGVPDPDDPEPDDPAEEPTATPTPVPAPTPAPAPGPTKERHISELLPTVEIAPGVVLRPPDPALDATGLEQLIAANGGMGAMQKNLRADEKPLFQSLSKLVDAAGS